MKDGQFVILQRRLIGGCLAFLVTFITGIVGYQVIGGEEWTLLDAAYMTVITLATVGYGETRDLANNPTGRIFTMFLILFGMGTVLYVISTATAFLVEGELGQALWRKKMLRAIEKIRDHFIVCGAGETGIHAIEELIKTGREFVVIDHDPERIERLRSLGDVLILEGDATDDEILTQAGVERARGLLSVLANDKDNLFVTITARGLNPNLRIVARGIDPKTRAKLLKAGANSVVSPNFIGGLRMVSEMIRPSVTSFLDLMLRDTHRTMRVEEVTLSPSSELSEKNLVEAQIRKRTGCLVMAIKPPDNDHFIYTPDPSLKMKAGSVLVILADVTNVEKLRAIAER
ncbi:MAG: potassium channel protein [Candidatus Tectomicrobia bacterium]|nr:potassium channel protein [Candidatus Tectomicrobia bacterium]